MSQNTRSNTLGFTLIEILVATVIVSTISIVSVKLLWDTISVRSKTYSIEDSSENFRFITSMLTNSIQSARNISTPDSSTIEIFGEPCQTFKLNASAHTIEHATDESASCTAPDSGFVQLTSDEITIDLFEVSPVGEQLQTVSIEIKGVYKDSIESHPFTYFTSVTSRITL